MDMVFVETIHALEMSSTKKEAYSLKASCFLIGSLESSRPHDFMKIHNTVQKKHEYDKSTNIHKAMRRLLIKNIRIETKNHCIKHDIIA